MRWIEVITESMVDELEQRARVLSREIRTLETNKTLVNPDDLDKMDDQTYERKNKYLRAQADSKSLQLVDKYHELEVLKAKISMAKNKSKAASLFTSYSSQKNNLTKEYIHELGKLIDQADQNLGDLADIAVSDFIGMRHSEKNPHGIMMAQKLEDAFSGSPSEQGKLIRQQLAHAFKPVGDALRAEFGDSIELHRSQMEYTGGEQRNILSWTGDLEYAQTHHKINNQGSGKIITKSFPISDIVWISDRANQREFIMLNHKVD